MRWYWFFLSFLMLATANVRAQAEDLSKAATARALFEEGVSFAEGGHWQDAKDRFERALALRDSQVIRFNLAFALAELGDLIGASELLRRVAREEGTDPELRERAQERLDNVLPRLAKLTVKVVGPAEGLSIRLDESELSPAQLGIAMPINPGAHQIHLLRGGKELDTRALSLADGSNEVAEFDLEQREPVATPSEAAATVALTAPLASAPRDDRTADRPNRKLLWWGIGGGVAAVAAVAVVTGILVGRSGDNGTKRSGDFDPPSIPVTVQ